MAAVVLLLVVGGGGAWYWYTGLRPVRIDLITHTVQKAPLQLTVVERGALESAENSDVYCRVKSGAKNSTVATTIKSIIDDGSVVKKGDLLVELDDSGLTEQLKQQKITLDKAEADKIQAEEAYKIIQSQNESDIKTAETTLELAKIDLQKYLEGDYPSQLKDVEGKIKVAESDVEQQRERAAWSQRMVKKGYQTTSQAQAEQSKLESLEITLAKAIEDKRVLTDPVFGMKKRQETDLANKVAEAERALTRVKTQAAAKQQQAESDRQSKKSIYEQELSKYHEIEDEIRKCTLNAPQDGMVVYFVPEQSRFGTGSQQSIVAQGEPVREGQKLMRIPDLSKMQVNTRVHEAMVSRVRGEVWKATGFSDCVRAAMWMSPDAVARLASIYAFTEMRDHFKDKDQRLVYGGQQATIRVDAFPDRLLRGHVKSVATVAAQADWMSSDVKVYTTIVSVDEPVENLKPGMSAEVTILVESQTEPVLQVPVQAIVGTPAMGKQRKVYVLLPDQTTEERQVTVGRSNVRMAEIKEGLEEGDEVVINPRVLLSDREKGKLGASADKAVPGSPGNGKAGGDPRGGGKKGPGGPGDGFPGGRGGPGGPGDGFPGGRGGPGGPGGGFPGGGGRGGPPQ